LEIKTVGVVGCGLMGSGIAEVAAKSGFDVVVREIHDDALEAGKGRIRKSLDRAVAKEKLSPEDRDEAWDRFTFVTEVEGLKDCDIVIEAIVEDLEVKNELFGELDELCGEGTIFASNTSSLTVTDMAASTERPDRFVGLGTLPMQDADLSIRELERCVESIRLAGVQIGTHVNGWNLDDPRIFPILEAAADLGAAVFVHPWQMLGVLYDPGLMMREGQNPNQLHYWALHGFVRRDVHLPFY